MYEVQIYKFCDSSSSSLHRETLPHPARMSRDLLHRRTNQRRCAELNNGCLLSPPQASPHVTSNQNGSRSRQPSVLSCLVTPQSSRPVLENTPNTVYEIRLIYNCFGLSSTSGFVSTSDNCRGLEADCGPPVISYCMGRYFNLIMIDEDTITS